MRCLRSLTICLCRSRHVGCRETGPCRFHHLEHRRKFIRIPTARVQFVELFDTSDFEQLHPDHALDLDRAEFVSRSTNLPP